MSRGPQERRVEMDSSVRRARLEDHPFYEWGQPPRYYEYHDRVDYLDELERIWGRPWGSQGIGRLREVAMVYPTEVEVDPLFEEDPAYFVFDGRTPDLGLMQAQHDVLAETYRSLGITVHYMEYSERPRSAYGPMKRAISAAAGFVIDGGAVIPREAAPYWRGRSRYVAQFLMSMSCPILYTVHGKGVCEIGAFTRMTDDFIVAMLSTDCNEEGLAQVEPVLRRAGYREILVARTPGPVGVFRQEAISWMHADMWIAPLDVRLALVYPPHFDYGTIRRLYELDYELIEVPSAEQEALFPTNLITIEPRKVVMVAGARRTKDLLEANDVEVIEVPYGEVQKYGGGIRCTTMQLVRDPGPRLFEEVVS